MCQHDDVIIKLAVISGVAFLSCLTYLLQMEQCCSSLACHQAELPDSTSIVAPATQGDIISATQPPPLGGSLSQAKMHQAGLEQEQQSLASLEHRLQHALSLSGPQDPGSPGSFGQQLVTVQQSVKR